MTDQNVQLIQLRRPELFWSKVDVRSPDECWIWQASKDKRTGYGWVRAYILGEGYWVGHAHRLAYQLHNGPITKGLGALHTCDIKLCVNHNHLYAGTPADNMRDWANRGANSNARKTHCPQGHPYDSFNTVYENKGRFRRCKKCKRAEWHRYSAKKKAKVA